MGMIHRLAFCMASVAAIVALAAEPGRAQCTGDCSGDNTVAINELIIGVGIALGSRPPADCPAFQNASGMVDITQLIRAVNFALNGCPRVATVTPTETISVAPTATATPVGTIEAIGTHHCTLKTGNTASHIAVNRAGFDQPSVLPLVGSIDVTCGSGGSDGRAACSCSPGTFQPIGIQGIGKVCIEPSAAACPQAPVACSAGGSGLSLIATVGGNVGTCTGNADCAATCASTCGTSAAISGCTGFCSAGTMQACNNNASCAPNDGVCNGADPVGVRAGRCQCECLSTAAGNPARSGELQCTLSASIKVVAATDDCSAAPIFIAPPCTLLTTAEIVARMTNADYGTSTIPRTGVLSVQGAPLTCDALRADDLTGLKLRGLIAAFGSTGTGDALDELFFDCQ